jgi:hypothetical protein
MKNRLTGKILAVICILVLSLSTALAAESDKSTLTVACKSTDGTKTISGMKLSAYNVGSKDIYGNYELDTAYSTVKTPTSTTTVSELTSIVNNIVDIIETDGIVSDYSTESDSNGSAVFENVSDGIYVIIGDTTECDGYSYTMKPLFVEINSATNSNDSVDISAVAKVSEEKIPVPEKPEPSKPAVSPSNTPIPTATPTTTPSATPEPDKPDATPTDTPVPSDVPVVTPTDTPIPSDIPGVTPTDTPIPSDIPEITPTDIPSPSDIPVTTPADTTITGDTFVPTATPTPDLNDSTASGKGELTPGLNQGDSTLTDENQVTPGSSSTSVSTSTPTPTPTQLESKLPQTGQLWWPVPILFVAGAIFIGIGIRLSKKEK